MFVDLTLSLFLSMYVAFLLHCSLSDCLSHTIMSIIKTP